MADAPPAKRFLGSVVLHPKGNLHPSISRNQSITLQGINISHLGKRKIIFKMPFLGDMLVPWRVASLKLTISPRKNDGFLNRNLLFQASIFRGENVSFREGTSWWFFHQPIEEKILHNSQILDHFPRDENKKGLSCHHPDYELRKCFLLIQILQVTEGEFVCFIFVPNY